MSEEIHESRAETHLKKIRAAEIEEVKPWFKPGMRVLEIGGGSGFQASLMSSFGCEVYSIDIENRPDPPKLYFSVKSYDGVHIPFKDHYFDLVFSSNVLEHVRKLSPLFLEMKRVLKPSGMAIHILPTPAWRFWTSLSHYIYLPIYLIGRFSRQPDLQKQGNGSQLLKRQSIPTLIKKALWEGPHGEYPSAFSELYYFSQRRWISVFEENQFEIMHHSSNGLFYTGYSIFKNLSFKTRQKMSCLFGASCHIFITRDRSIPDN